MVINSNYNESRRFLEDANEIVLERVQCIIQNRKYFCDSLSAKLEIHSEDCQKLNCTIRLPSEDDKRLSFCDHCRKKGIPFIIYVDHECALKKVDRNPESATQTYQHYNVFSIGYHIHCSYDSSQSSY
ncbi:hypothetical protein ALC57_11989 [Trachymyrmex cornetzi]|uniref:Uncharacterized protein n=1 Tax=Trachymyrmex cornetzi TaxID=471704 RepID=A0A151J1X6_9HYME|nr:hypothetical protein ALC57_11989 [Trachymyrmex cornetzi]